MGAESCPARGAPRDGEWRDGLRAWLRAGVTAAVRELAEGYVLYSVRANARGDERMVVIAGERMDADPGWQNVGVGELIHVGPELELDRQTLLIEPPRHPMVLGRRRAIAGL